MLKRAFALLRVLASAFALMGMSWRSQRLLGQLFPAKFDRKLLAMMGHPIVNVMVWTGLTYSLAHKMVQQDYSQALYTGYFVLGYLVLRKCVLFRDRPQDLETTPVKEQQAWIAGQSAMVQRRYARCEQPLHKDTWKELQRLANGLDDVARAKAVKRAAAIDAVLPQAPRTGPPRRF